MALKTIEVADKPTLDKILPCVEPRSYYGFIEHNAAKSPSQRIEYIGINKD